MKAAMGSSFGVPQGVSAAAGMLPPSAPLRLIDVREVCNLLSLGRSTVYAKVKAGEFPSPVRLGKRCTRWRDADVQAFINAQSH